MIPKEKLYQVVEPPAPVEEDVDDDLRVPPEQMVPQVVDLLEYKVLIHLLQVEEVGESIDCSSRGDWVSDDDSDGGAPGYYPGTGRQARGPRRNSLECSRGRVDSDDVGDHPGPHVDAGRRVQAGANTVVGQSRLSATAPAFVPRPASPLETEACFLLPERGDVEAGGHWDPMRLEASLSSLSAVIDVGLEGSSSPAVDDGLEGSSSPAVEQDPTGPLTRLRAQPGGWRGRRGAGPWMRRSSLLRGWWARFLRLDLLSRA